MHTHVVTSVTDSSWFAQGFPSFSAEHLLSQSSQSLANFDGCLCECSLGTITPGSALVTVYTTQAEAKKQQEIQSSGSRQGHPNWGGFGEQEVCLEYLVWGGGRKALRDMEVGSSLGEEAKTTQLLPEGASG